MPSATTKTLIFVHHTLQHGYPLAEVYARFLDEPIGRYRTVEPYPLVVPYEATCRNRECGFEHRVCSLLNRKGEGHQVEGDLFEVDANQLRLLDIEECHYPGRPDDQQGSFRRPIIVEPLAGGDPVEAEAHFNENSTEWDLQQIRQGVAEMVPCYTREMAEQRPKQCCIDNPGHKGFHTISTSDDWCDDGTPGGEAPATRKCSIDDQVREAVKRGTLDKVEDNPHYAIYALEVKEYPAMSCLVQTSGSPINLGPEMLPLMDTDNLRAFIEKNQVPLKENSPLVVYLYNWVDRAQGPMVFDVGMVVEDGIRDIENEHGFVIKHFPAMKFASIVYEGPFPREPMSGWDNIRWEQRAQAANLVYTERLYRELYHHFDYTSHRHITEVQIEVE